MKNCKQCGKNDFSFKKRGAMTVVTCRNCKNEFEFLRKNKPTKKEFKCSKCKATMERVKIVLTPSILLEQFYFTYKYTCKCGNEIMDPTTKRFNAMYKKPN